MYNNTPVVPTEAQQLPKKKATEWLRQPEFKHIFIPPEKRWLGYTHEPITKLYFEAKLSSLGLSNNTAHGCYMVFVNGREAPKIIHTGYVEANMEADRLAKMTSNVGKFIYVLEIKDIMISSVEVEEIKDGRI